MSKGRILIVSSGPACCNPRPAKEAQALQAGGYEVTLLSRAHTPGYLALDRQLAAEGGYQRQVVPEESGLLRKLRTWLGRRLAAAGLDTIHALGEHRQLLTAALRHPADLTIVHTEVPLWVGGRLLDQGRRVAADFEDWHSEDLLPNARRHRPLRLLRALERRLLQEAAYCSTTSEVLAETLHQRYGGRLAAVLTNSFPLQPEPNPEPSEGPPSLFWYSQTLGPGRGLEPFLQAWATDTGESRLVLLGEPVPGYADFLLGLLPSERRGRVSFLGLVSPQALPELIARHDLGLALEESAPESRRLTITNKILQYLNAGLAVVASDTAGQREVFARNPGIGALVRLDAPDDIARGLRPLLGSRGALREARLQARSLARGHYNWEREADRLLGLVDSALMDGKGSGLGA